MSNKTENQRELPVLYWQAEITAEFSNTNNLHHKERRSSEEKIELTAAGKETEVHEILLKKFETARIEKSIEPNKNYCLLKHIELKGFSDETHTQSVNVTKTHYQVNRSFESFYGMNTYSLLRSRVKK